AQGNGAASLGGGGLRQFGDVSACGKRPTAGSAEQDHANRGVVGKQVERVIEFCEAVCTQRVEHAWTVQNNVRKRRARVEPDIGEFHGEIEGSTAGGG